MNITDYSFGRITVNGKTFTSDLIIFPDQINSSWWRKEGHLLQIEDLKDIVSAKPDIVIIGTGFYGAMRIPEETLEHLKLKGIEIHFNKTSKAVELYNRISFEKSAIAALHLTC